MTRTYRIDLEVAEEGTVVATNGRGASVTMRSGVDGFFSPVELLCAALGGCSGMDFPTIMRKQRRPVLPLKMAVTAERPDGDNVLTFARVAYLIEVTSDNAAQAERAARLTATKTCTVSRTLEQGCAVEHALGPESG